MAVELASAVELTTLIQDSPAAVVIRGPAGIGKTTLCRQAMDIVRSSGYQVASADAQRGEGEGGFLGLTVAEACAQLVSEAYRGSTEAGRKRINTKVDDTLSVLAGAAGAGAILFPPLAIAGVLAAVPAARSLLDRRSRGTESIPPDVAPAKAMADLVAGSAPAVVHIGDAQWLTDASLTTLERLAREFEQIGASIPFLIEIRVNSRAPSASSHVEGALSELARYHRVEWLDLETWSQDDIRVLVEERFSPNSFASDVFHHLHSASGGNPMITDLLLDSALESGAIRWEHGVWEVLVDDLMRLSPDAPGFMAALNMRWQSLRLEEATLVKSVALSPVPIDFDAASQASSVETELAAAAWSSLMRKGLLRANEAGHATIQHELWRSFVESEMSTPEKQLIHSRLATVYESGAWQRSHHLLKAGSITEAGTEAEFTLELAKETGDLHEQNLALQILESIHEGNLPDRYVLDRVNQLRRSGETREALAFAEQRSAQVPTELHADLIHLSGDYPRAHQLLRDEIKRLGNSGANWKLELRAAHHLKFVDPQRSLGSLLEAASKTEIPRELKPLTQYTIHGSLGSLLNPFEVGDDLIATVELALEHDDLDTAAKAARKLGEWHMFVTNNGDAASAVWHEGSSWARRIHSRQRHYLDTVSYWPNALTDQIESVAAFYDGRHAMFHDLGIPMWAGHCQLLLAEALRMRGYREQSARSSELAHETYVAIGMLWGVIAADLSLQFARGASAHDAVNRARQLGLEALASHEPSRVLPLLLP